MPWSEIVEELCTDDAEMAWRSLPSGKYEWRPIAKEAKEGFVELELVEVWRYNHHAMDNRTGVDLSKGAPTNLTGRLRVRFSR